MTFARASWAARAVIAGATVLSLTACDIGGSSAPGAPQTDPSQVLAYEVGVNVTDVAASDRVYVLGNGTSLAVATLNLCGEKFVSDAGRAARYGVNVVDKSGAVVLTTEGVVYKTTADATAALTEFRGAQAACGPGVHGGVSTAFGPAPDAAWGAVTGVQRVSRTVVRTNASTGKSLQSIEVILARGRVIVVIDFDSPQTGVAGKSTYEAATLFFEKRLAAVPPGDLS